MKLKVDEQCLVQAQMESIVSTPVQMDGESKKMDLIQHTHTLKSTHVKALERQKPAVALSTCTPTDPLTHGYRFIAVPRTTEKVQQIV